MVIEALLRSSVECNAAQMETARCVALGGPLIRKKCEDENDQRALSTPSSSSEMAAMRIVMVESI
jgi:hypothetical protein